MNREVIDGVTTFWRPPRPDEAGTLTATLTFGCGIRDEDLDTLGITHLVTALAVSVLQPDDRDIVTANLNDISIELSRAPAVVAEQLAVLCQAFADPPIDRLPGVLATIDSDDRDLEDYSTGLLLHHRFGSHGPGLGRWWSPRYDTLRPATVRAYAARFFVRGNAVLALNGPPPPGLRLPLPPGPRVDHPPAHDLSGTGPRWFTAPEAEVTMSFPTGRETRWFAALGVLERRVERAAAEAGLRCGVWPDRVGIDAGRMEMAVSAQPAKPRDRARAAEILWRELRRLAGDAPTAEEISACADKVRRARATLNLDNAWFDDGLLYAPDGYLFDTPPDDGAQYPADLERTPPSEVVEVAQEWIRTALLVVPPGTRPDLPGMAEDRCPQSPVAPGGRVLRRPALTRLLSRGARLEQLILDPAGLSYVDTTATTHTIWFADVLMVEERGPTRTVTGRNGCVIVVDPARFPRARRVVRAIDAAVPPHRRLTLY